MMRLLLVAMLAGAACAGRVGPGSGTDADAGPGAGADGGPAPGDADAGTPAGDPSAELYDPARLPHFELELAQASVDALAVDPRTYVRGTLRYGAEVVTDVGVRLKGEYNFRPLTEKAAFKLKFDEFVPGQEFRGLRRMNLNNSLEDPSFIAERLVYDAYRAAGVPAPRCNDAVVTVNGELYGVYVNVETEDKTFVARWFANNDGNIYEELGAELTPGNETAYELETNETLNDRGDLAALIAALDAAGVDTFVADVSVALELDAFLRFSALEAIVNQWDGYAYTRFGPNNFRLYGDPDSGRMSFIPWGMDMALKPLEGPFLDPWDIRGLLLARCVEAPECLARYQQALADMADLIESLDLAGRAATYRDQIAADVAADPRREVDPGTVDAVTDEEIQFLLDRPATIRATLP